jgi:flagellar hook protein FlgE
MASTTALFSALSGLNANARNLDVIGNNIANVNTTAFKSSRLVFAPLFSRTLSSGSAPTTNSGGTDPLQIGLGVSIAATQRNFTSGSVSATGDQRDLAVQGNGFFIVDKGGDQLYTRAGAFRQNAQNDLVTPTGERVKGYGVDSNYNIISGVLVDVNVPVGTLTAAEATRNVRFSGNLNAAGARATQGTSIRLGGSSSAGLGVLAGSIAPTSLLTEIQDPAVPPPASPAPLFTAGQIIELSGVEKGSRTLPSAQLPITAATTIQDLTNFLNDALGIQAGAGANPVGGAPGVALDPVTGNLAITGNTGSVNDLSIDSSDFRVLSSAGALLRQPLTSTKTATADGESVRTTFVTYDSLGSSVRVDMAMVLENKDATGTGWRYYVESADDTDSALQIGTGQVAFDTSGRLTTTAPAPISIDRAGTGAATPLNIQLAFTGGADNVTALADQASTVAATFQDGSPIGTLAGYAVGQDGTITGSFTNGLTRTIGQIALAAFTNPEGLVDRGDNLFGVGANSGTPVVTTPGQFGTGQVVGGALELSNVDLGKEFIDMILTSTGYSASSRVIKTTDDLMQQLLVLGR